MRIYLAGKMDKLGNWRDGLLLGPRRPTAPLWHASWPEEAADVPWETQATVAWPEGPNTLVLGTHDYTGPYRSLLPWADSGISGILHGNEGRGQHGLIESEEDRNRIHALCMRGILRCDLFFAYINDFDSFGTFAEIGMAFALNKHVVLVEHEDAIGGGGYGEDLWFVGACAHRHDVYSPTGRDGGPVAECAFLRTILLEEISRCSVRLAQVERRKQATQQMWDRATGSFQQILRWTSDPRVRDEARRMIRYLDPTGESAA